MKKFFCDAKQDFIEFYISINKKDKNIKIYEKNEREKK